MTTVSTDPSVAIAVLQTQMTYVVERLDAIFARLETQDAKRTAALEELEERVESIEASIAKVRWFITGLSAGAGLLGGGVAGFITSMLGG